MFSQFYNVIFYLSNVISVVRILLSIYLLISISLQLTLRCFSFYSFNTTVSCMVILSNVRFFMVILSNVRFFFFHIAGIRLRPAMMLRLPQHNCQEFSQPLLMKQLSHDTRDYICLCVSRVYKQIIICPHGVAAMLD